MTRPLDCLYRLGHLVCRTGFTDCRLCNLLDHPNRPARLPICLGRFRFCLLAYPACVLCPHSHPWMIACLPALPSTALPGSLAACLPVYTSHGLPVFLRAEMTSTALPDCLNCYRNALHAWLPAYPPYTPLPCQATCLPPSVPSVHCTACFQA